MKKLALSIFILGSFGLYVLSQSGSAPTATFVATQPVVIPKQTIAGIVSTPATPQTVPVVPVTSSKRTTTKIQVTTPTPVPAPTPEKTGLYTDGTYTGSVADAYYGNVQVQAIISGGKIANVIFLNYPQDRNTSRRINSQAMPYLTQEAIQAQSANVDGVSGASDTSAAFKQSLASALSQARA